jgi:hypothetical protein
MTSEPLHHGRAAARAAPLLPVCNGLVAGPDWPAAGGRGVLLERSCPCNIALMRQAQAVKKGVASANGTPREFCTITVTDGIAMGHEGMKSSLVSRDVITIRLN